jgi:beta-lactamase class A
LRKRRNPLSFLRWISLALIFAAVLLTVLQLVRYSRMRSSLPSGMVIAGVPVGGLSEQQAADRLTQIYGLPVEMHYGDAVIQIKPANAGFTLDLESMLAVADLQRVKEPFWNAFWDFLWNRLPTPSQVPIRSSISKERLRSYLVNEVAPRYDRPPVPALPMSGSTSFEPGQPGTTLDVERALILVEDALNSPTNRVVNLSFNQVQPPRPSFVNLQILLQRVIELSDFDGLVELYMLDLQSRQELHFAYERGANLLPDIAFTAASTIKIPIMVSAFRRYGVPAPEDVTQLMELMIERSENDPADALMKRMGDTLGPLLVTADMEALGLQDTFIAGYFAPGSPLLKRISTPANQRTDVFLDPDPYNQTTPSDMGMLLDDIYQCAESGGGTLAAVFPGEVTQTECRLMISYLARNNIAVLLQAGVPEGVQVAHKHGWITENDGLIHTMCDAALFYSPGGNYIITLYMYHPVQVIFDVANQLAAELSNAIYNYYNITGP